MGNFIDEDGRTIDKVLAVLLPGPSPMIDITTHGGVRIVQRIIETLQKAGAKLVSSEELIPQTFYADENPVMAEAYRLLPSAKTTLAVKFLLAQAQYTLQDYHAETTHRYWPAVRAILDDVRIVLAGPPNAGKSTLMNALSRTDEAIVSDLAGTTRDYVATPIDLTGIPVELIDTAGLGETNDPLATAVRRRTIEQFDTADVLFIVLDAADLAANEDFLRSLEQITTSQAIKNNRVLVLINKIDQTADDIGLHASPLVRKWPVIEISALKQTGLEKIAPAVRQLLNLEGFDYRPPTIFSDKFVK
jgi:small GTP-binding protein